MSEDRPSKVQQPEPHELPAAVARHRRGIPLVWIIPALAALIAVGIAYRDWMQRGPTIQISFDTAADIEPGKTAIRFRAVQIGTVSNVSLGDEQGVVVAGQMSREAAPYLVEGARFWVVRPRVGLGEISGLSTLVSGAYIALAQGHAGGKPIRSFTGLERPPLDLGQPGARRVELEAKQLAGVGDGDPIYYRDVEVGRVAGHQLAENDDGVVIHALIAAPYTELLHENTRFWNASGIHARLDLQGAQLDVESLRSLLVGGIAFETPGTARKQIAAGHRYTLFEDRQRALEAYQESLGLHVFVEASELGSIQVGTELLYRGLRVGKVISTELDKERRAVRIRLQIQPAHEKLVRSNSYFWRASGVSAKLGLTGIHIHTDSLESLLAGGIAFASPDTPGPRAAHDAVFELHDKAKRDW